MSKLTRIEHSAVSLWLCDMAETVRSGDAAAIRNAGTRARWTEYCLQNGKAKEALMDTLEKTIDWTPMTESSPPESDYYLVTRKDPLLTTTAFY